MKKTFLIITLSLFAALGVFASGESFFTPEISLGTGVSIYDDKASTARKVILDRSDYKRIIAGLTADTNLNISEPIKVIFGAEAFCDFLWIKGSYYHTTDYAFFSGIKIFPGVQGLNFSIAYTLGNRTDFFSYYDEEEDTTIKKNDPKSWGNGFRLGIQYDFMEDRDYKVKPQVGVYYRCIPRGNYNTDHILSIYGGIRF